MNNEQKIIGTWTENGACRGTWDFNADGTLNVRGDEVDMSGSYKYGITDKHLAISKGTRRMMSFDYSITSDGKTIIALCNEENWWSLFLTKKEK